MRLFDGEIHVIITKITDRHRVAVPMPQKGVVDLVPSIAEADIAQAHTAIGTENARVTERSGHKGALSEISASELVHRESSEK